MEIINLDKIYLIVEHSKYFVKETVIEQLYKLHNCEVRLAPSFKFLKIKGKPEDIAELFKNSCIQVDEGELYNLYQYYLISLTIGKRQISKNIEMWVNHLGNDEVIIFKSIYPYLFYSEEQLLDKN